MEILAGSLDLAIKDLGVNATKMYERETWLDDKLQVWQLSKEEFEKLSAVTDGEWRYDWGWWRGAYEPGKGPFSNMEGPIRRYNLGGHYIKAWDQSSREEEREEAKRLHDEYLPRLRTYYGLLDYFENEIGATEEKNIAALACDLAEMNGLTLAELFEKYETGEE